MWQRSYPEGKPQCPTKNQSWDALGFNHTRLRKYSFPTLARQQLTGCATKTPEMTSRGRHEWVGCSTTLQVPCTQRKGVPELERVFSPSCDDQSAAIGFASGHGLGWGEIRCFTWTRPVFSSSCAVPCRHPLGELSKIPTLKLEKSSLYL